MKFKKIGIVAGKSDEAREFIEILCARYDLIRLDVDNPSDDIDVLVVLSGDGFMLHMLHKYINKDIPIYGMNCGTVGFLMNQQHEDDFIEAIETAGTTIIHPIKMQAVTNSGEVIEALAINEISLIRKTSQAAKIKINIDGITHMDEISCDGMLLSTPAGSSAYNCSVGGPILPLKSDLLALTPISPFRPRRWRGAILPHKSVVELEILRSENRPVNAVADFNEIGEVKSVKISEDRSIEIKLLFDKGHSLEERIIQEQFAI